MSSRAEICCLAVVFVVSSLVVSIGLYMKKLAENMGDRD